MDVFSGSNARISKPQEGTHLSGLLKIVSTDSKSTIQTR